ncbi:MAG: acyl carrier protein [Clostridia bacterium]|nr:acyl carrier protein [Clostridia bacterium]
MFNVIRKALLEYVDVPESEITPETNVISDLNMNSYDFISLIGKLESELGIEIPERDLRQLDTVGSIDEYIRGKLKL